MMPLPRLLLTIASALCFVWVTNQCLAGAMAPPQLNLEAAWHDGGLTVTWVRPAGQAWEEGVRPGARVISIDGQPTTRMDNVVNAERVEVVYQGETHQTSIEPVIQALPEQLPTVLTLAGCFATLAHWYFLVAYRRSWAWLILFLCGSAAYALVTSIPTIVGTPLWGFNAVIVSLLVFCSACLLFFLGFPVNQMDTPSRKYLAITSVTTSVIMALLYLYVIQVDPVRYDLLRRWIQALQLVNVLGAGYLAVTGFMECRYRPHLAEALGIVGIGLLLGVLPFCGLVLLPNIIAGTALLSPYLVINSIVFFALGLAISTTRLETYYAEERGALELWEETIATMRTDRLRKPQEPPPTRDGEG